MPKFKAIFCCIGESELKSTEAWIKKTGMFLSTDIPRGERFEIQLIKAPKVLLQFYCLQGFLSVSQISDAGITFYLVDAIYTCMPPMGKPISARADNGDGIVFCPMSNVVCINDFGPLYIDVQEVAANTFETAAKAAGWLQSPHPMLGGKTPQLVAKTLDGMQHVLEILAAIKHGGAV